MANGVFTVGESGQFTFEYLFDGGWFQGELGIYNLAGLENLEPGSEEYIQEAASRALSNSESGYLVMQDNVEGAKYGTALPWEADYNSGDFLGAKTFNLAPGQEFAFILTQNTSLSELSTNPGVYTQPGKRPIFSVEVDADRSTDNQFTALDEFGTFGFESGSDRDYNDVVFQVTGAAGEAIAYDEVRNPSRNFALSSIAEILTEESESNVLNDGYLTVGQTGEVAIDVLYDGGFFKGELAIFNLDGLDAYESGSDAFALEAARRALSNSTDGYVLFNDEAEGARFDYKVPWEPQFNSGAHAGVKTIELTPGGQYGLLLAPDLTVQDLTTSANLGRSVGELPFFSMRNNNILNAVQFIDHNTGNDDTALIGVEDLNVLFDGEQGGDRDYNDVIVSIEGASFFGPGYSDEQDPSFETIFPVIAVNDADLTYKDTTITIPISELLDNDLNYSNQDFSLTSFDSSGSVGLVSLVDGEIVYNPNNQFANLGAGESAIDSFTYTITDEEGQTSTTNVDITINGFDADASENAVGNSDTIHFLPPLYAKQDVRDHFLTLSTNEDEPFEVTIQNAAGAQGLEGGITETVTISKDSPLTIDLSSNAPYASGFGHQSLGILREDQVGIVDNLEGLVLNADQPFYANVRHQTKNQGLSLSAKGQLALGTEFRSGHLVTNTQEDFRKAHFISVMASEDNTIVSFQDLPEGASFVNGTPGQIVLDKYESITIGLNIQDNHADANSLQGSLIVADKPVAVNSGSWLAGTFNKGRDIGVDQILPVNLVGSKYILVKGEATSNADVLERPIVIATQDNTEIYLRGEAGVFATLNAGEELILSGNEYSNSDSLLIETSKPAYVYQMTSANNTNAPGLNFVYPVNEDSSDQDIIIPEIDLVGPGKLNIVARTSANVAVNGSALSGGVPVDGDSNYLVFQIEGLSGDVRVTADESVLVNSTTGGGNIGAASYWSGLPTTFASDDSVSTSFNTRIDIDVLANDLTGSGFAPIGFPDLPQNGTVSISADNTLSYNPALDFIGSDVFVYRGVNDQGKTDTALVSVRVGQDLVDGSVNDDVLLGSVNSDRITGFAGNDTISTGAGNDTLVYKAPGDGVDTITDFTVGNDTIDLTAILGTANPLESGTVTFTQSGNDAVLNYNGSALANFTNSDATALNDAENFVF